MLTINYSLTSRVEDRSQRTTGSWRIEDRTHNLEGPHDSTVLRKSPYKAKDYQLLVENKTWTERLQRDKRDLEITTENLRLSYSQSPSLEVDFYSAISPVQSARRFLHPIAIFWISDSKPPRSRPNRMVMMLWVA